jgi:nicotinic acid mononucleotide adenylyltransferase
MGFINGCLIGVGRCDGVIGIGRPGTNIQFTKQTLRPLAFSLIERQDPVSSSQIREALLSGKSIAMYTFPQVIEYMQALSLSFRRC